MSKLYPHQQALLDGARATGGSLHSTIPDGTNRPSATTPMPQGWVVEAIIKGRMSWMIKPEPLKSYTFTHDLAHAHVFDREGQARDCRAVWCWHDRHGHHPSLTVIWLNDEYRAQVAANALPANHQHGLVITTPTATTRPTFAFVRVIINAFVQLPNNGVGGTLHIVLDDDNTEDEHVEWCRNHAQQKGDTDGVYLAELLQQFTQQERNEILRVNNTDLT